VTWKILKIMEKEAKLLYLKIVYYIPSKVENEYLQCEQIL